YVVNKLAKGFVGTANIDTNSRLCMASSVAGHKRAFGSATVPGCYEDLVPSGAAPAHAGGQGAESRLSYRCCRSAANRDLRGGRPAFAAAFRKRRGVVQRAARSSRARR